MVDLRRRGTRWNVFGITTHETFELDGGLTHFLEGRMDASFGTTPLAMTTRDPPDGNRADRHREDHLAPLPAEPNPRGGGDDGAAGAQQGDRPPMKAIVNTAPGKTRMAGLAAARARRGAGAHPHRGVRHLRHRPGDDRRVGAHGLPVHPRARVGRHGRRGRRGRGRRPGRAARCVAENVLADGGEVGFEHPGGYGEYLVTEARNVQRLPADFPLAKAALIEPLAVTVRGMRRLRLERPEQRAGAGGWADRADCGDAAAPPGGGGDRPGGRQAGAAGAGARAGRRPDGQLPPGRRRPGQRHPGAPRRAIRPGDRGQRVRTRRWRRRCG